jgi:competence protein ComEC
LIEGILLRIHFLNVGHGDCAIIEFPTNNRVAMIDINKSSEMDDTSFSELEESYKDTKNFALNKFLFDGNEFLKTAGYDVELQNPINYLSGRGIKSIFRFIITHPHMDHLTGLSELNECADISNFWILRNEFSQDFKKISEEQQKDWSFYKKLRDTNEVKVGDQTIVRPTQGDIADYWNEDGIEILAPDSEMLELANTNDNRNLMSYVLLIKYGNIKIVLGGDAEKAIWEILYDKYPNKLKNVTILKASHHGRDSGYFQKAVELMNPRATVISVGKKPPTDVHQKYSNYSGLVFSTRWCGNIYFECEEDGSCKYHKQYDH